jgi:thiol-disulfide isomerase/thioredoxin
MNIILIFCLFAPIKTLVLSDEFERVETSGDDDVILDVPANVQTSDNHQELSPVEKVLDDFEKSILENDLSLNKSSTDQNETASSTTAAGTHRLHKPRVNCVQLAAQVEMSELKNAGKLILINGTELQSRMLDETSTNVTNRTTPGICSVILFYGNWCQFSAQAAPSFNSMPRFFPKLNFYAIEVANNLNIFSQFAVVALPSVLVFHNGKPVYGFNSSTHSLETYIQFISNYTGLKPEENEAVQLIVEDYSGPVPSTVVDKFNYNLLVAYLFIILCVLVNLSKSTYVTSLTDTMRNLWREVEIQHEHAD